MLCYGVFTDLQYVTTKKFLNLKIRPSALEKSSNNKKKTKNKKHCCEFFADRSKHFTSKLLFSISVLRRHRLTQKPTVTQVTLHLFSSLICSNLSTNLVLTNAFSLMWVKRGQYSVKLSNSVSKTSLVSARSKSKKVTAIQNFSEENA